MSKRIKLDVPQTFEEEKKFLDSINLKALPTTGTELEIQVQQLLIAHAHWNRYNEHHGGHVGQYPDIATACLYIEILAEDYRGYYEAEEGFGRPNDDLKKNQEASRKQIANILPKMTVSMRVAALRLAQERMQKDLWSTSPLPYEHYRKLLKAYNKVQKDEQEAMLGYWTWRRYRRELTFGTQQRTLPHAIEDHIFKFLGRGIDPRYKQGFF